MQWLFFRRCYQINFHWRGSSPDVVTLYFWEALTVWEAFNACAHHREWKGNRNGGEWCSVAAGLRSRPCGPSSPGVGGGQAAPVAVSLSRLPLLQRCFSPGPAPALCFLMAKTGDISLLLHSHPYSDQKCVPVWTKTNSEMNMLIRAGLFSLVFSNPVSMQ